MSYSLSDTSMYDLIDRYASENSIDLSDLTQVDDMHDDLVQWLEMELQNYIDDMDQGEEI